MKKIITLLFIMMFVPSIATALTLLNVSGEWADFSGGTNVTLSEFPVAYGNGNQSRINWGKGVNQLQSGLGFTGADTPQEFDVDEYFVIGQLAHFNERIRHNTGLSSVRLDLSFYIDNTQNNALLNFYIDETPNNGSTVDDIIHASSVSSSIEIIGFGPSPDDLSWQIQTPEEMQSRTLIWGRVNKSPVPEPATLYLLGAGLLAVGRIVRKRLQLSI